MSTFSHTDWTVVCDYQGCIAQERTDTLELGTHESTATNVRKHLKRRGWAVAVPSLDGSSRRLDFCPKHKPPRPVRVRGYGGYRLPPGRRGSTT